MVNKVALVTGGTSGIGKEIVKKLIQKGSKVVTCYSSNEENAKLLESEINSENLFILKCDVSNEQEVSKMFNAIINKFNGIDILVNNAGIAIDTTFEDKTVENFRKIIDVNLIGTYLCSKYVGKVMLESKKGKIINISSTNAIDTFYPESCDYDASKAGVISLTHNMAREFAPNISVNCVCPGWVNTDMNKDLSIEQVDIEKKNILINRFAEPEEIAKVICFLASPDASYINDSVIRVDGGKYNC